MLYTSDILTHGSATQAENRMTDPRQQWLSAAGAQLLNVCDNFTSEASCQQAVQAFLDGSTPVLYAIADGSGGNVGIHAQVVPLDGKGATQVVFVNARRTELTPDNMASSVIVASQNGNAGMCLASLLQHVVLPALGSTGGTGALQELAEQLNAALQKRVRQLGDASDGLHHIASLEDEVCPFVAMQRGSCQSG